MKRLWRRRWLLIAVTMVVFLSVGTVAWAATTGGTDAAEGGDGEVMTSMLLAAAGVGDESGPDTGPGAAVRRAMRDKLQEVRFLRSKLLEELREEMTPADQALYDQLTATLEQQREALQKAREELKGTLEQLRDLGKKYVRPAADGTGATG
ncbi:MAG: hypothetical protein JW990_05525 [Thermoleophilia bacterium]|nr:hypothetical protein [Thermoleophilia bacterium]